MDDQRRCYVVVTDESGRYEGSVGKAIDRAVDDGAQVILYDVTAPGSSFSDPRPNKWAGEGEEAVYDRPLDPVALEKLGRHELALQVQRAGGRGIEVYGWLPDKLSGDALAAYAAQQQADLVLIPAALEEPEITEFFTLDDAQNGVTVERI